MPEVILNPTPRRYRRPRPTRRNDRIMIGEPLDRPRMWLALFALIMFVLCYTPAPIEPLDLVRGH